MKNILVGLALVGIGFYLYEKYNTAKAKKIKINE